MIYLPYTGIGSRRTPNNVLGWMASVAQMLDACGYTLRSGGATGADTAFMNSTWRSEIFLPWPGFNGYPGQGVPFDRVEAAKIARKFHPAWGGLSGGARNMHTRNVPQVLGADLASPTRFVVCWTPSDDDMGGTGQAIRIAEAIQIPVIDARHGLDWAMSRVVKLIGDAPK